VDHAQNGVDRQLAGGAVRFCQIVFERKGLPGEHRVGVGDKAPLAHGFGGHRIIRGKIVMVGRVVKARVLRFDQFLDAKKLHVAIDHAAHFFAKDQQLPGCRGAVRFARNQFGIADVVSHVVRHAEIDVVQSFGPRGNQGVGHRYFDRSPRVQVHVRIARVPAASCHVDPRLQMHGKLGCRFGFDRNHLGNRLQAAADGQPRLARRKFQVERTIAVKVGFIAFGLTERGIGRRLRFAVAADDADPGGGRGAMALHRHVHRVRSIDAKIRIVQRQPVNRPFVANQ
jgi:hypothetical protein